MGGPGTTKTNLKLKGKIRNLTTKDYLDTKSESDSNFATKTDIISFSNKITDLHYEISALTSNQSAEKPNSALNGHKAEKELEVYEKIWQATGDLYFSLEKLNIPNNKDAETEKWKENYDNVVENYQKLLRETENQRIFYPKELYPQLQKILRDVKNEIASSESSAKLGNSMTFSKDAHESLERIRAEVEQVHNFIRIRLNQL